LVASRLGSCGTQQVAERLASATIGW